MAHRGVILLTVVLAASCTWPRAIVVFEPQPPVTVLVTPGESSPAITSADGKYQVWFDDGRSLVVLRHVRREHLFVWPARPLSITLTGDRLEWQSTTGERTCWYGTATGGARPCDSR